MEEEAASEYGKGGYLRVSINEKLNNGRYIIKRKLGWGMFSTVWLAEDTQEQKHVALKICRSDRETCETAAAEIAVLQYILWEGNCHGNIVQLIETFSIPARGSSRSSHTCIVFELLGPNLLTFLESHIQDVRSGGKSQSGEAGGLPIALVQEFAKQLLCGTSYLHDFCRHIHTDLKLENIAIQIPDIERVVKRDLSHRSPASLLVESTSAAEVEIYESQPIPSPIYAFLTPRSSYDKDELSSICCSSSQGDVSASGSSSAGMTASTTDASADTSETTTNTSNVTPSTSPITLSSSPIAATFATLSRKIGSFGSWAFARSPPTELAPISISSSFSIPAIVEPPKPKPSKVLPSLGLKIVDFGNAQPVSDTYIGRIQTRQYRAPEVIIGRRDWDRKVDVWSIACIVFELATGDYLFDPPDGTPNKDQEHICQIISLTNPHYDRRWVMGGRQSSRIFDEYGDIPRERRLKFYTLEQRLEEQYHLEKKMAKELSDFLLPMLEFEPCNRATAKEMGEHPWLANTAFKWTTFPHVA